MEITPFEHKPEKTQIRILQPKTVKFTMQQHMVDFNLAKEMLMQISKQQNIEENFSDEYIRNLSEILSTYCSLMVMEKKQFQQQNLPNKLSAQLESIRAKYAEFDYKPNE